MPKFRFSIRLILFAMVLLSVCFAVYGVRYRRVQQAIRASNVLNTKGFDALFIGEPNQYEMFFPSSNLSDRELDQITPFFNGSLTGLPAYERVNLNGSPVSEDAIKSFRAAVPDVELIP